jgi:hypothetical protein
MTRTETHRIPFCPGCGCYLAVHGDHRSDCTAAPKTWLQSVNKHNREKLA